MKTSSLRHKNSIMFVNKQPNERSRRWAQVDNKAPGDWGDNNRGTSSGWYHRSGFTQEEEGVRGRGEFDR
jgi:hypothetical protein